MNLGSLLYQLETEILVLIAKLVSQGDLTKANAQIKLLAQMGTLNSQIMTLVLQYRAAAISMTKEQIEQAAQDMLKKVNTSLPVPVAQPQGWFDRAVDTWVRTAATQADLTMSTLAANAGRVYSDIIARAYAIQLSGDLTRFGAMAKAVTEWGQSGLAAFVDKAGRTWGPEATANMIIRSNQRRVATQIMFDRGDQAGTDLIEVSSHMGARPGCAPYQGRIYSRRGADPNYPPLSSTTYGQPDGLFGINCRHVAYPFFPGISEQRNRPLPDKANSEAYKQSQEQRRLERGVREADREYKALKAMGPEAKADAAAALSKKKAAENKVNDFIAETGRTRRENREKALIF